MKIAMILSTPLPPREGIGFYAWNLAKQLTRRGHNVHLITRGRASLLKKWEEDGITIWEVPFFPVYPFHVQIHNLFVQQLVNTLEPELDLLHLHSPLVMAPRTTLPLLVTVHNPLKADVRSIHLHSLYGLLIKLQLPFSVLIENNLFHRAGKLVAVASSVANELREYNIDPINVLVFGNAVDTTLFSSSYFKPDLKTGYFVSVGRLGPRKGLEDLIESVQIVNKDHPDIKFFILGDGPLFSSLQKKILRAGLEKTVILTGHISDRIQLLKYYQSALGFIHPAHYEGLPTVLLEAMACGKAVISTSVSGAVDVIENKVNGLLVGPKDPSEMAQAIQYLLQNPDNAARMGRAACETVCRKYTWEIVSKKYEAVYQDILCGRNAT